MVDERLLQQRLNFGSEPLDIMGGNTEVFAPDLPISVDYDSCRQAEHIILFFYLPIINYRNICESVFFLECLYHLCCIDTLIYGNRYNDKSPVFILLVKSLQIRSQNAAG